MAHPMTSFRAWRRRSALGLAPASLGAMAWAQSTPLATPTEKCLAQERFTLIAPFPPGGPIDSLARKIVAQ